MPTISGVETSSCQEVLRAVCSSFGESSPVRSSLQQERIDIGHLHILRNAGRDMQLLRAGLGDRREIVVPLDPRQRVP